MLVAVPGVALVLRGGAGSGHRQKVDPASLAHIAPNPLALSTLAAPVGAMGALSQPRQCYATIPCVGVPHPFRTRSAPVRCYVIT